MTSESAKVFLSEELARRLKVNPAYSQRAFAKQLGVSAGELSEVLRGKRNLSLKSALRIAKALGFNPEETKQLIYLAHCERTESMNEAESFRSPHLARNSQQLTMDVFQIISDWYCLAIYSLADTEGFRFEPAFIGKRLGIAAIEAGVALKRLERVGLIERKSGSLRIAPDFALSPNGIPSEAVRNHHAQMLAKAQLALTEQPVEDREFRGAGFAIHPDHLPAIRKEISEFQNHLIAKYSRGKRTEVYHLEIAFFKLTQKSLGESREKKS